MRDPHVNTIRYKLKTKYNIHYKENCNPIYYETSFYKMKLENNILVFDFKEHYSSVEEAKQELYKLLKAWEIDAALTNGIGALEFEYLDADLVDRNPSPKGFIHSCEIELCANLTVSSSLDLRVLKGKYPDVPTNFQVNPDVEIAWKRYEMYLEGKDQLLSMAYFCLSFLEGFAGKRSLVEEKYKIERTILDTLGSFTSERGDPLKARKGKGHRFIPLTKEEESWIEECVKLIIRRMGEYEKDPNNQTLITMNDLPKLN